MFQAYAKFYGKKTCKCTGADSLGHGTLPHAATTGHPFYNTTPRMKTLMQAWPHKNLDNAYVCEGAGKARVILTGLERNTAIPSLNLSPSSLLVIPGCGKNPLPPRGPGSTRGRQHAGLLPTREPRSPQGGPGRGKRSSTRRTAGGLGREEGDLGGCRAVLLFPFALLLPRLGPSVTGKPPEPPGGRLFIARAARASRGPARLTGPLTRLAAGPSPRGCAPDAGDNGLLCAAAAAAGGRGPGAGGRGRGAGDSPAPFLVGRDPPKGNRPLSPPARTWALWAFFFFYFISKFPLSQPPLSLPAFPLPQKPPQHVQRGASTQPPSQGRPLCEPRGAGPVPGAPSGGCGDQGAGSAGQVTYPGPRVGGLCLGREERNRGGCERRTALPGLLSPLLRPTRLRAGSQSGCVARRAKEKLLLRD
nr:translation initiation factor IF-2-like [Pan paniscus]